MKKQSFLAPLLLLSFSFPSFAKVLDRVVAVVGDEPILLSEVSDLQTQISSNAQMAKIYEVATSASKRELLEKLIEAKIITLSLKDLGAEVSEEDVEKQISSIASQNGITKSELEASLRREGVNVESYRRNIRTQLERRNIFDRQLRQSTSNPSEAELRGMYERVAGREVNILLLDTAPGLPATKKRAIAAEWKTVADQVAAGKLSYDAAKKQLSPYSLDWVSSKSLNSSIGKVLENANAGSVLGPIDVEGRATLVFFEGTRRGSNESFEKMRGQLESQARSQGFDNRMALWLERRKQELHIVVNNL